MGILDEQNLTKWDATAEEFGVVNGTVVLQQPYSVVSIKELVLTTQSYILVALKTGYQILELTKFEIVFSFLLQKYV